MTKEGRSGRAGGGRRLTPAAFLAGVACAFLACCAGGRIAADLNGYVDFVRFHVFINAISQYHPTASQVRALGRERLEPDRVAVVVGGNSILYGFGQGPKEVWTARLEEALGDRFRVINLALPGAAPGEFGGLSAEILERDHPKLLLITDCSPLCIDGAPGAGNYPYFFWDAYYKGMVRPEPRRDAALAWEIRARDRQGDAAFAERRMGARLDAALWFQDLWTAVAYQRVSTVWSLPTAPDVLRPRRDYKEAPVPQPPPEQRYPPAADEACMQALHLMGRPHGAPLTEGTDEDCLLGKVVRNCYPETCRRRTLMLIVRESPHYVNRLSVEERATYDALFPACERVLEHAGMTAMDVGGDFAEMDYFDRLHLSEQGGRRLAAEVAPKVRELAEKLGYLP